jgi:hypothetical protein
MEFYNGEYGGLIEFSSAVAENPFGATLLELVENQYDDIDTAIKDITETLIAQGFDASEDIVIGLMTGEILPEVEVVQLLSELGTVVDEDGESIDEAATERNQAKLFESAIAAYDLYDEGEVEEEVDEDEEEYEGPEAEYDYEDGEEVDEEAEAAFSRYFEAQEAMQNRLVYTDALGELRDYAEELRNKRHLTPHAFNMLFSRRAKDDYMNFSQVVEGLDYSPEEYLMCMDFALNLFEELGPVPGSAYQFSSVVEQEVKDAPLNFNSGDMDEEARDLLNLLHGFKSEEK